MKRFIGQWWWKALSFASGAGLVIRFVTVNQLLTTDLVIPGSLGSPDYVIANSPLKNLIYLGFLATLLLCLFFTGRFWQKIEPKKWREVLMWLDAGAILANVGYIVFILLQMNKVI